MNHKLIISNFYHQMLLGFRFENDRLLRIYDFHEESVLGNIYCGYVKDVVKNIDAAFVEFDRDKKGYYPLNGNETKIHQGDKVLVQVSGDRIKNKDYKLTSNINLNSRCLVLTVGKPDISISKKIEGKEIRGFFKEILNDYKNEEYGFILRTNSVNFSTEQIKTEAEYLVKQWENIKKSFQYAAPKSLLLKKDNFMETCKEYIEKYNGDIVTDNISVYNTLYQNYEHVFFNGEEKISLCNKYSLEKHLKEALEKKVWLKSGAYLVIEVTEALTVIDVNTGKADCRTKREETIERINREAAVEIARQIQVRNLSGIIIVDFINMRNRECYNDLEQVMNKLIINDFSTCRIMGFTKLGLMEISRKKAEKPLHEIIEDYNSKK